MIPKYAQKRSLARGGDACGACLDEYAWCASECLPYCGDTATKQWDEEVEECGVCVESCKYCVTTARCFG